MTDLYALQQQETNIRRRTARMARIAITVAGLACTLMFWLQYAAAFIYQPLYKILFGAISSASGDADYAFEISKVLTEMVLYVFYLVIPFVLAYAVFASIYGRKPDNGEVKHGTPKMPFLYLVGCIGLSYLINLLVYLVNLLLGGPLDRFNTTVEQMPQSTLGIILEFVMIAVLPAILEEWAFRGIIQKYLIPYGRLGAILISGLMFGLMHLEPQRVIFATVFGIMLGICYDYTRSIKFTALIHFANNLLSVALSYVEEDNIPAAMILNLLVYAFMGIGLLAVVYYIISGIKKKKVSFIKPNHIGVKLTAGKYMAYSLLNAGTFVLILTYAFFLYFGYFMERNG